MTEKPTSRLKEIAAEWREARRIYPIYSALITRFDLPLTQCRLLDSPVDRSDDESTQYVREWLQSVDESIEAAQLRQVLQSTTLGTEASLGSLARRYLAKPDAAETYRDRIEFLLAQYFSQNATAAAARGIVSLMDVARSLEPVIGPTKSAAPAWIKELDELLARLEKLRSLRDFLTGGVPEQGRVLKSRYSAEFLQPAVLAAITRYNFLVRLNFIRLLHHDLERIQKVTHDLLERGVKEIDGSGAGLSKAAKPEEVLRFTANWKAIFRKDYSERQVAMAVVKVLDACEQKLRATPEPPRPKPLTAAPAQPVPPAAAKLVAAATAGAQHSTPAAPKPAAAPKTTPAKPSAESAKPAPEKSVPVAAPAPKVVVPPAVTPAVIQAAEKQVHAAAAPKPRFAMYEVLESVAAQLSKAKLAKDQPPTATVEVGGCKVMLSSWEIGAFLKGGSETADLLQQAVVARAIVSEAVERCKKSGTAPDLKSAIALGRAEVARLQESIAQARDAKNIDAAVNLAATQKRLLQILDEATKL